jgi:hypothetical protein
MDRAVVTLVDLGRRGRLGSPGYLFRSESRTRSAGRQRPLVAIERDTEGGLELRRLPLEGDGAAAGMAFCHRQSVS